MIATARKGAAPWAMLAIALLASSCDFWSNLTEPKRGAKSGLTLDVRDAWTGEPLAGAVCLDSLRDWSATADDSGRIRWDEAPTGPYRIVCGCDHYRDAGARVEVPASSEAHARISLGRKGGAEWYPDDPERQVRMSFDAGNTRFPGKFTMNAYPRDTTKAVFSYEWSASSAKAAPGTKPEMTFTVGNLGSDTAEDTVRLAMHATLGGETYVVGGTEFPLSLTRNKKPLLVVDAPGIPQQTLVGCKDNVARIRFSYEASDPDGNCLYVKFTSTAVSAPSLGLLDQQAACGQKTYISFPLIPPAVKPEAGFALRRDNTLSIGAWDDNGEVRRDSLKFTTITNMPPDISLIQVGGVGINKIEESLRFSFVMSDFDGFMQFLRIDWGDGSGFSQGLLNAHEASVTVDTSHVYHAPSPYTIHALVVDYCGDSATVDLHLTLEE